jgi:hypothetical protein
MEGEQYIALTAQLLRIKQLGTRLNLTFEQRRHLRYLNARPILKRMQKECLKIKKSPVR